MSSDRVQELEQQVEALSQKVEMFEERLEEIEDTGAENVDGAFDSHDGNVLNALAGREGDEFHVRALMQHYRDNTNIRRKETLKRRVKDLTRSQLFERVGRGRHRFVGGDADGE